MCLRKLLAWMCFGCCGKTLVEQEEEETAIVEEGQNLAAAEASEGEGNFRQKDAEEIERQISEDPNEGQIKHVVGTQDEDLENISFMSGESGDSGFYSTSETSEKAEENEKGFEDLGEVTNSNQESSNTADSLTDQKNLKQNDNVSIVPSKSYVVRPELTTSQTFLKIETSLGSNESVHHSEKEKRDDAKLAFCTLNSLDDIRRHRDTLAQKVKMVTSGGHDLEFLDIIAEEMLLSEIVVRLDKREKNSQLQTHESLLASVEENQDEFVLNTCQEPLPLVENGIVNGGEAAGEISTLKGKDEEDFKGKDTIMKCCSPDEVRTKYSNLVRDIKGMLTADELEVEDFTSFELLAEEIALLCTKMWRWPTLNKENFLEASKKSQ